jgi:hypothetical protein
VYQNILMPVVMNPSPPVETVTAKGPPHLDQALNFFQATLLPNFNNIVNREHRMVGVRQFENIFGIGLQTCAFDLRYWAWGQNM